MTARPADVVPVVASDWLRPRLGRTWTHGVVVGVTPRAAYVRIDLEEGEDEVGVGVGVGDVDRDGIGVGVGEARAGAAGPGATDPSPDDRGRTRAGPRPPPGNAVGSHPRPSVPGTVAPLLALEAPGAVGLPNGLDVTIRGVVEQVRVGEQVTLDGGRIRVGQRVLGVRRWRRSVPAPGAADDATVRRRLDVLGIVAGRTVPTDWPDPPDHLRTGLHDLHESVRNGDGDRDVVDRLLGWGSGSTPAGDDLLAAWIATVTVVVPCGAVECAHHGHPRPHPAHSTCRARARVVARVRERAPGATTALSATLLDAAADGAMARPAAAVLTALTAPDGAPDGAPNQGLDQGLDQGPDRGLDDLSARLDDLAAVGHTSGRDLACGMLGAVWHLVAAPPRRSTGPVTTRCGQA